ncbi:MAG: ELM1/GtrOC1 family putative glycosyltransferase [Pseudomonadota bacterium]
MDQAIKQKINCLILSDQRPGHYHLSEGVVAALERVYDVGTQTLNVTKRTIVQNRFLRFLHTIKIIPPSLLLQLGYGVSKKHVEPYDVVISAGSSTLIANIAFAKLRNAHNIFCGSLRNLDAEDFSVVITSYQRDAERPHHVAMLKPSVLDPDRLGRPKYVEPLSAENPPQHIALLIGGDSATFQYKREEWYALFNLMEEITEAWGTKWLVSTSRRTDDKIADILKQIASMNNIIEEYIDYRVAGPGTLTSLFAKADAVMCTEESSTMISEAINARLPVIGIAPEDHYFHEAENEYRDYLLENNWTRSAYITDLSVLRLDQLLSEIEPITHNPLDKLARVLHERLS